MKSCFVIFGGVTFFWDKLIEKVDGRDEGRPKEKADGSQVCLFAFVNQQLKGWRNKVGVLQDVLV